ncbi:MAG: HlyD family secretion protein [Phycisphaerae bacterium]|jgi:membrane fusion protein (multidrug efflux system)
MITGTKSKFKGRQTAITAAAVLAALGLIWGLVYAIRAMSRESTDDAFITGHIISISARVSGYVDKVPASDNQSVQQGDVLVELDPRDYQVALDMARAKLLTAQADETQSRAQADMVSVEAGRTEKDYNRYKQLFDAKAGITQQQLDNASAAARSARAQFESANSQIAAAQARVAQAKAAVEQAELNLSYTKIIAPQAGLVTKKSVEQGEHISTGQPLLVIVTPEIWVVANFKETQLKHMKAGQQVTIKVDAYSGKTFRGHIDSIQAGTGSVFSLLPPENATGNYIKVVQRVPVKIVFDEDPNNMNTLSPGMSVIPVVKVK